MANGSSCIGAVYSSHSMHRPLLARDRLINRASALHGWPCSTEGSSLVSRHLVAVLIAALAAASAAEAQTTPAAASEGPTVVAAGEGLVKRAPDRAWLQITAE